MCNIGDLGGINFRVSALGYKKKEFFIKKKKEKMILTGIKLGDLEFVRQTHECACCLLRVIILGLLIVLAKIARPIKKWKGIIIIYQIETFVSVNL